MTGMFGEKVQVEDSLALEKEDPLNKPSLKADETSLPSHDQLFEMYHQGSNCC